MFKLEMSNKKDWFTLLTFIANGIDNWRLGYTEEKLQHENPEKEIQQRNKERHRIIHFYNFSKWLRNSL